MTNDQYLNPLLNEISTYLKQEQIDNVVAAYHYAAKAHGKQTRASGEPYITHPLAVAEILARMHLDADSIAAAILHDVLEDTEVSKVQLAEKFGSAVAELVDGVSKLTKIQFETRAEAQAENFRKMVLAMARDIRVILIKLADRLHNMRTLGPLETGKKHRIALETLEIYAPIANRLGMHAFRVEFEELGFEALYPMRFKALTKKANLIYHDRKKMKATLEKALKAGVSKAKLLNTKVKGHDRHLYSIYKKMRNNRVAFTQLMDTYAFKIIVDTLDDCYRIFGVVHNLYKPMIDRFKDYIAIPKANGYQALHTTLFGPFGVPIEIQIRTEEMERLAENGIAAHWLYKTGAESSDSTHLRAREWLKRLLELQQSTGNSLEFIENVKTDLFSDEVYVFTPKGAIIELPKGATPIDFAYSVHSDIGDHCVAVKIDRQSVPLSTVLHNGQTIEIITSELARPNPSWLNFVASSKARSCIRHFLKQQRRNESIELGKRLLSAALNIPNNALNKIDFQPILDRHHFKTTDELYENIGIGNFTPAMIAHRLNAPSEMSEDNGEKPHPLLIHGTEGMVVQFAECCCPIPGDEILGVLNQGQGLMVHIADCNSVKDYVVKANQLIATRWEDAVIGDFKVEVEVEIANERGALASLAAAVANSNANIETVNVNQHDSRYSWIELLISVQDRTHLARVLRRIRSIKNVVKVARKRKK